MSKIVMIHDSFSTCELGFGQAPIDWYDSKSSTNREAPWHPQSFGHFTASGSEILEGRQSSMLLGS